LSIVLTQTDVHWVEAQLLEQRTKLFLDALQQVLAHIEAEVGLPTACRRCGGGLVRNGRVPLVLETLLGRVEYARQRLRSRGCGGASAGGRERAAGARSDVRADRWDDGA